MDWKSEAIDKLKLYNAKKAAIENIALEIRCLEADFASIRSARTDATPVQGGGSTREDMLLSNIAKREELARQLEIVQAWVAMVDAGLALLPDSDRKILDRFYINRNPGHVERLSTELNVDRKTVYYRKGRALRHFAVALYGSD